MKTESILVPLPVDLTGEHNLLEYLSIVALAGPA